MRQKKSVRLLVIKKIRKARIKAGYCAVGCGEDLALGSLHTTEGLNWTPADRIKRALEAAEKFSSMVQRPFHVLNTLGE